MCVRVFVCGCMSENVRARARAPVCVCVWREEASANRISYTTSVVHARERSFISM